MTIKALLFIAFITHHGDSYTFQPIKELYIAFVTSVGEAFVSHSSWRLLYYYDISDFYSNIEVYKESLARMIQVCDHLEEIGESTQCMALILKHKEFLNDINLDLDYLNSMQTSNQRVEKRKKRQAPLGYFTTYVLKPTFGIMDEDDAQEMVQKINNLAESQEKHHNILEQNLSIIRRTIEITNSSLSNFQNSMMEMNKFINNAIKQIQEVEAEIKMHVTFQ